MALLKLPMRCLHREQYNRKNMVLIDTHTHLYLPHFNDDIEHVIKNAEEKHVTRMLLPNIDITSFGPMMELCNRFPDICHPMLGLHPTSVKEDYREKLSFLESVAEEDKFVAVGETGMDAYHDRSFLRQQEDSFITHLQWAKIKGIPIVIHSRNTMEIILPIVRAHAGDKLRGVFHAFSGTAEQAMEAVSLGFKLGIGGVVTYKNSGLNPIIEAIDLENIVLETDSPYLTPVPKRGKRNESANLVYIAEKIAGLKGCSYEEVAHITSKNAYELFNLKNKQCKKEHPY